MTVDSWGAICFGLVIGWVTYRTLRRTGETVALSNIASVIAAVGGGAVVERFQSTTLFAWYCIGLAGGFFLYMILGHLVFRSSSWLGGGE